MKKIQIIDSAAALRPRTPLAHIAALTLVAAASWACSGTSDANDSGKPWSDDELIGAADSQGVQSQGAREPASPDDNGGLAARSFAASGIIWKRWTKGDQTVVLAPHRTHICGLSMIRGEFVTGTVVSVTKSADFWTLSGFRPGSNTLQVDSVCVPLSGFRVNSGTATIGAGVSVNNSLNNRTITASLPAFSAPILTLVQGASNGFGEYKFVFESGVVGITNGTAQAPHGATAFPLSFGLQRQPLYSEEKELQTSKSSIELCTKCTLADLSTNFCFLSGMGGNLDGADEWAQVYPDFATSTWRYGVSSGGSLFTNGSVKAKFTCLNHDQSTIIVNPPR